MLRIVDTEVGQRILKHSFFTLFFHSCLKLLHSRCVSSVLVADLVQLFSLCLSVPRKVLHNYWSKISTCTLSKKIGICASLIFPKLVKYHVQRDLLKSSELKMQFMSLSPKHHHSTAFTSLKPEQKALLLMDLNFT